MTKNEPEHLNKPELMSPAGHWPQLRAAVTAGADAVYFGLQHFSARAKVGFTLQELPDAMKELHRNGVKGFVTFNTLVFDHELNQAAETIQAIANSGVDAIIVQDIGVAKLARQFAPDLDVHGSTQMSITSAEGAELAASLGCSRVVLGRELDLKDIRRIAAATDVELEVFVHGALCVSYSGQCFSSEAWGGRSANRGQCAQACRLSYDLIVDGAAKELGAARYLLSPGDLYAVEQIPDLVDIGISCLKIEGRYKDADYVALTTTAYRQAIDSCFKTDRTSDVLPVTKNDLEQIYSRGLDAHFMAGTDHQTVVNARAPRHRGLWVGKVADVQADQIIVDVEHEIHAGDGVVFDSSDWRSPDLPEEGGNVFGVSEIGDSRMALSFGRGLIDYGRIRMGDLVWRTNHPILRKKTRSILNQSTGHTVGLSFKVVAKIDQSIVIQATSSRGERAKFTGDLLKKAETRGLTEEVLEKQLGRLGNTPFHLQAIASEIDEQVFCPVSILNQARREIVERLIGDRESPSEQKRSLAVDMKTDWIANVRSSKSKHVPNTSQSISEKLHLLVRNQEQLEAAIDCQPASITLDYLELYGLRPSVEKVQNAGVIARVASPRILKPSEQKIVRFLLSLECKILVRSGGLLHDLVHNYRGSDKWASGKFPEIHGDFSLNAANAVSFDEYIDMGLQRIAPTHDLNAKQIEQLASTIPAEQLEVIAFHHLPVFHTEHCVFCRFLSDGTDNTNCGHPCEKHSIAIRDSNGRQHPVLADVGCRNTVFGAEAQTAVKYIDRWREAGVVHYRLEFVHQSSSEVQEITTAFQRYFDATTDSAGLDQTLRQSIPQGTTDGSLFVPQGFEKLVQLQ